jgi:hypothetical protein
MRCYRWITASLLFKSRILPNVENNKGIKSKFQASPIGYFHIDIAEVCTAMGRRFHFVAIDRTAKFAFTEPHEKAKRSVAADFLRNLIEAVPYEISHRSDR